MKDVFENFGRNISFVPQLVFQPGSADELLGILNAHPDKSFRAMGRLHCWSRAIESDSVLIDTSAMDSIEIAEDRKTVTVGGGCRIKALLKHLDQHDLTLPSVGLIDKQSIAGATATGTHGSGKHSLSHYIQSVTIAHFDSRTERAILTTIDSGDELRAARCSLGLLGIVVALTIQCRPRFQIEEHAIAHDSLDSVLAMEKHFPLQQFYLMPWSWQYFGHHRRESNHPRSRTAAAYRWYCFLVIDLGLHLSICLMVKFLRIRFLVRFFYHFILPRTIVRNWRVTDQSQRMLLMEHDLFRHIEIEVFVQRRDLEDVMGLLIDVVRIFGGDNLDEFEQTRLKLESVQLWADLENGHGQYQHHYPICIRRVIPDDTLISMSASDTKNTDDWYAISLISYAWPNQRRGFYLFADVVAAATVGMFRGRCHWGKHNPHSAADIKRAFSHLSKFNEVVHQLDPHGRFGNEWLTELLEPDRGLDRIIRTSNSSAE